MNDWEANVNNDCHDYHDNESIANLSSKCEVIDMLREPEMEHDRCNDHKLVKVVLVADHFIDPDIATTVECNTKRQHASGKKE